ADAYQPWRDLPPLTGIPNAPLTQSPVEFPWMLIPGTLVLATSKVFLSGADQVDMLRERSEARMLCADLVDIRWKDKSGRGHKVTALLEDISHSGACVQLDAPIPNNTVVRICHPKGQLQGSVKYCVYRDIGYFVGLQFKPDSKWSRREFQ